MWRKRARKKGRNEGRRIVWMTRKEGRKEEPVVRAKKRTKKKKSDK